MFIALIFLFGQARMNLMQITEAETSQLLKVCEKLNCKSKETFQVTAISIDTAEPYRKGVNETSFGSLVGAARKCVDENCEFCCLSNNRCGTKIQCENSKKYFIYFNITFIALCVLMLGLLVFKCVQVDGLPDHNSHDKLDKNFVNELLSLFSIIKRNKQIVQRT